MTGNGTDRQIEWVVSCSLTGDRGERWRSLRTILLRKFNPVVLLPLLLRFVVHSTIFLVEGRDRFGARKRQLRVSAGAIKLDFHSSLSGVAIEYLMRLFPSSISNWDQGTEVFATEF